MCYTGNCPYESYPHGRNEGCVCRKPRGEECYLEQDDNEDENEEINIYDENDDEDIKDDINGISENNIDEFDRELYEDDDEIDDEDD